MKKLFHKIWLKFITAFGNLKVFKFPMFIVYDPSFFKIDGVSMMKAFKRL